MNVYFPPDIYVLQKNKTKKQTKKQSEEIINLLRFLLLPQ
jgi:hypothetical protein